MVSSSNKLGSGWKPMDNFVKNRPMSQPSSRPKSKGPLPRSRGRVPPMLSNGQATMIRKRNLLDKCKQNNKTSMKQSQLLQQKKFTVMTLDKFVPQVKKELSEPTLPMGSTPTSLSSKSNTSNSNFQSASVKTGASQQTAENNITSNDKRDNTASVKDESNDNLSISVTPSKKDSSENVRKLKKRITKLETKLSGYKQNEILFRKNTSIITDEIFENQFKMASIYGQLAVLKENNQNLNNFQDYLINDLINTKLDYKMVKQNLVEGITKHFETSTKIQEEKLSKVNDLTTFAPTIKGEDEKDEYLVTSIPLPQSVKEKETAEHDDLSVIPTSAPVTIPITTTPTEPITSIQIQPPITRSPASLSPSIPVEPIKSTKTDQNSTFNEIINSKENRDNIVTKNNLNKLETGVLHRITELEELEISLRNEISHVEENSKIIDVSATMESPYVKNLRNSISNYNKDLKNLHTILNNRTINFQLLLNKSEKAYKALEQRRVDEATAMKDYIDKSQAYMTNASSHITRLEKGSQDSLKIINDLKRKIKQQGTFFEKEIDNLKTKHASDIAATVAEKNKNTNNNSSTSGINEQEFEKMNSELKSSQNLCLSQQHTIEILSRELYNAKTELSSSNPYNNNNTNNNGGVTKATQLLLDNQKKKYEEKIQLVTNKLSQELGVVKSQYISLLSQYTQLNTNKKVIDPQSVEVKELLIKERKKFLGDIKQCLDIISKEASLKDTIKGRDVKNATDLLSLVTTKLIVAADNATLSKMKKTSANGSQTTNIGGTKVSTAPVQSPYATNPSQPKSGTRSPSKAPTTNLNTTKPNTSPKMMTFTHITRPLQSPQVSNTNTVNSASTTPPPDDSGISAVHHVRHTATASTINATYTTTTTTDVKEENKAASETDVKPDLHADGKTTSSRSPDPSATQEPSTTS